MSLPQDAQPAKLVISLLMNDKSSLLEVAHEMMSAFGAIDMVSGWMDFDYTDYYAGEMGSPLYRRMLVFRELIAQEALPAIKLTTNALEDRHAEAGRRSVNIDPGYLLLERFVLATGKNYTHRIFIGSGIYADLTLIFQQGDFQTLPWTYPDYGDDQMRLFLKQARRKYAADLRLRHSAE
jgi:hypothetical protein